MRKKPAEGKGINRAGPGNQGICTNKRHPNNRKEKETKGSKLANPGG